MRRLFLVAVVLAGVVASVLFIGGRAAPEPALPPTPRLADIEKADALQYLVQSACADTNGGFSLRLPFEPDCANPRLMREDDRLPWRKHDWGGAGGPLAGWQASDAVLAERGGVSFADQTFDFGAPATDGAGRPDAFGRFDGNDGGDAIIIVGDTVSAFLTQDGGTPGLQWFIGRACDKPGLERYIGWVLFRSDLAADWHSVVAELGDEPADACPARFNRAFTRYRLTDEALPVQRLGADGVPGRQTATLRAVLVEHYDAATIAKAHALERFYYARGLGKVRWEAWSTQERFAAQADALARSGRCPALADSTPPAEGWRMADCRMWTNIVAEPVPPVWRVRDFNWPPAGLVFKQAP